MTVLEVPIDLDAERSVVGCCVATAAGYRYACDRLAQDDLYMPVHRQLFRACRELGHFDGSDIDTTQERIFAAARMAGVSVEEVARIVDDRRAHDDRNGSLAAAVQQKALDRSLMSEAAQLYNAVACGDREAASRALRNLQDREVA